MKVIPLPDGVKIGRKCILTRKQCALQGGKFVEIIQSFEVKLMAIADGYAMVRRPSAMPFAIKIAELSRLPSPLTPKYD